MNKTFRNTACVITLIIYLVGFLGWLGKDLSFESAVILVLNGLFWIVVPILVIGLIKS